MFVSDLNFTPLPVSHLVGILVGVAGVALEVMYSEQRTAYVGAK